MESWVSKVAMNVHRGVYSLALGLLLAMLPATAWSAPEQQTLTACGHADYPPWNWRKGEQIVGVCAEITRRVFEAQGLAVDNRYVGPWKRCQAQVKRGAVDVNICAFRNDTRERYSVFMDTPMGVNDTAVFVKAGHEFPFQRWQDLSGKRAAMVLGVSMGQAFDEFMQHNTTLVRVSDQQQAYRMLLGGRVDFVATGRQLGQIQLRQAGMEKDIVSLDTPILSGKLYISMSKQSPYLDHLEVAEKLLNQPGYQEMVRALLEHYSDMYIQDLQEQVPQQIEHQRQSPAPASN